MITRDAAVLATVFDRNTIAQRAMKRAIVADERWRIVPQDFSQRLFAGVARNRGIQSRDSVVQPADDYDIGK